VSVLVSLDVSAVPAQPAGAGRYVVEVAGHLAARDDLDLTLVARARDGRRWEAIPGHAQVRAVAPDVRPLRLAWEQLRLPSILRGIGARVHHAPHYTMPERSKTPVVVTIHDMTFFDHPEWHERSKVLLFRRAIAVATKRAAGLVCVSHYTAKRLQERFGELPVTVIPHGVDHARFRPESQPDDRRMLDELGVPGSFIAFVGTLEPRKDAPTLVRAFDRVADSHPDVHLVLAGQPGWGVDAVEEALAGSKHHERVVRTGFIPDAAVPALLRRARVVAYPSLSEGFGLPALEALACGAPLITTSGSAMEEVVDSVASLVPPGDVEALADGLDTLLTSREKTTRFREGGPAVAARYTWEACAQAHAELYRQVASGADAS
jgi:glycosyltransferase involved in cell wall biosynthesis